MKQRTRAYKPKTKPPEGLFDTSEIPAPKTKRKTASIVTTEELDSRMQAEADLNGISKSEAYRNRTELTLGLEPSTLRLLTTIGNKLGLGARQVFAAAVECYLGFRMGVARVVPQGVVRYPEYALDKDGLITGQKRILRLTDEFARREQILLFGCFSLVPDEERSPEMDDFIRKVREDAELLREVERVMGEVEEKA